jgi:signal transduction histidine kinase
VAPLGTRWVAVVVHAAFFLLLAGALARYLIRHPGDSATPWVVSLALLLATLYVLGPLGGDLGTGPSRAWLGWLAAAVAVWVALVVIAPSFAWCAVPLVFTSLQILPTRGAVALVTVLTVVVVGAQLRLSDGFDPNLILAPPAVAALATAVFVQMQQQAERQQVLERQAGILAERERLSREIHDTVAQGLSSQQMLLQAADRVWDSDPDKARTHVRTAASVAEHNLAEARRFVHDLAPADLAREGSLAAALAAMAAREAGGDLVVRVHVEGEDSQVLSDRVQSGLLRIAQGALANVRQHADAATAALTLTVLDDRVVLDVVDDGRGFDVRRPDPAASVRTEGPDADRGHGIPAMRARARQLGGTVTIEPRPGGGTALSATLPLEVAGS